MLGSTPSNIKVVGGSRVSSIYAHKHSIVLLTFAEAEVMMVCSHFNVGWSQSVNDNNTVSLLRK